MLKNTVYQTGKKSLHESKNAIHSMLLKLQHLKICWSLILPTMTLKVLVTGVENSPAHLKIHLKAKACLVEEILTLGSKFLE